MNDARYKYIGELISQDKLKEFREIFSLIPMSVVAEDLKMNYSTVRRRKDDIDTINGADIKRFSAAFETDVEDMCRLVARSIKGQLERQASNKRRKN